MSKTLLLSLVALALLSGAAAADESLRVPVTLVLTDSYEGFTSPDLVTARRGTFQVCLGECHEGDPGFGSLAPGEPFEVRLALYRMEPQREGLPYVSRQVLLARGRMGQKVKLVPGAPTTLRFQGVTLVIKPLALSAHFGQGRTRIQVKVFEQP